MTDSDISRPATQQNTSWQRSGLGSGGRFSSRDFYDNRPAEPIVGPTDWPPIGLAAPRSRPTPPAQDTTGRNLRAIGLVIALAGAAGWLWLILTFVSSVGAGTMPDDPLGGRFAGIPLATGGLVAILAGSTLAAIGTWLSRTARDRRIRSHRPG